MLDEYNDSQGRITVLAVTLFALHVVNWLRIFIFDVKAPIVGYRSFLEPGWPVGLRFSRRSGPMVREGYHKVSIHCVALFFLPNSGVVQGLLIQNSPQRCRDPCYPAKVHR